MNYFIIFLIGLGSSLVGTKLSMLIARHFGVFDRPGEIKIHRDPIPRLGGLGIMAGFLTSYAAANLMDPRQPFEATMVFGFLVIGATGALDDWKGLLPPQKIAGQLLGGLILSAPYFYSAIFAGELDWRASIFALFAVFLVILMSNSINLLDGMDALAAGTALIAFVFVAAIGFLRGDFITATLGLALAGACGGFLFFNFPPAETFMGDAGSLFVGSALAFAALRLLNAVLDTEPVRALAFLLILLFPLLDTAMAVGRRLAHRQPVFSGDRLHIYDCILVRRGGNVYSTVLLSWLIVFACGAAGFAVLFLPKGAAVGLAAVIIIVLTGFALSMGSLNRSKHGKGPPASGSSS